MNRLICVHVNRSNDSFFNRLYDIKMAVPKRNNFSVYILAVCLLLETAAFVCVTFIQVGNLSYVYHYEKLPMQETEIFQQLKLKISWDIFLYFQYLCSKHRWWVHVRIASPNRF